MRRAVKFFGLLGVILSLGACQTDRQRLNIGQAERFVAPVGLFPSGAMNQGMRRKYASTRVMDSFKRDPSALQKDPVKTFEILALFEWLANDLRRGHSVAPHVIRKVLDSRNELRATFGMSDDLSTKEAVHRLYAMSKFLSTYQVDDPNEPEDVRARRQLLSRFKSKAYALLVQTAKLRQQALNKGELQILDGSGQLWKEEEFRW